MLRMLVSGRRSCGAGLAGRSRSALAPRSIAFALLAATPCAAQTAPPEGEQEPNALPPVNVSVDRPKPTARPSRGRPAVTPTPPAPVQPVTPATTSTTAATPLNGDTVATSASRLGLTVRQIPASIDIVDQQQIQEQGYRTTTDTAQGAVGVTAADAPGAAADFSMRGFSRRPDQYALQRHQDRPVRHDMPRHGRGRSGAGRIPQRSGLAVVR